MGKGVQRGASGPEEILSWRFPEGARRSADRETFARCTGQRFGGGPEIDREITERFDGVERASSWRGPPGPIGMRHSPETSTKGRRFVGTPAGVEKVSNEDYSMAASSLIRWGGSAALLGGLSTTLVGGLFPSPLSTQRRGIEQLGE
jgi:hypothetical protein